MNVKIKICGVTLPAQAREIAALGADYVGCVIEFPKSSRSITREQARALQEALKVLGATLVGVTVDKPIEDLFAIIDYVGLKVIQLHGGETFEYVKRLKEIGVEAWKVVYAPTRHSGLDPESSNKNKKSADSDFWIPHQVRDDRGVKLVEKLVVDAENTVHDAGGSGRLADWDFAKQLTDEGYSVVLSGGLTPENAREGITFVRPSVIDASSKLESEPGIKDMDKVELFIRNTKRTYDEKHIFLNALRC